MELTRRELLAAGAAALLPLPAVAAQPSGFKYLKNLVQVPKPTCRLWHVGPALWDGLLSYYTLHQMSLPYQRRSLTDLRQVPIGHAALAVISWPDGTLERVSQFTRRAIDSCEGKLLYGYNPDRRSVTTLVLPHYLDAKFALPTMRTVFMTDAEWVAHRQELNKVCWEWTLIEVIRRGMLDDADAAARRPLPILPYPPCAKYDIAAVTKFCCGEGDPRTLAMYQTEDIMVTEEPVRLPIKQS